MPAAYQRNDAENWEGVFFQFEVDDPDYVLGFQRTLVPSAQDVELDQAGVCITYCGTSAYHAVHDVRLTASDVITLTLVPAAARALGLDQVTEFGCDDIDDLADAYAQVRRMLDAASERPGDDPSGVEQR